MAVDTTSTAVPPRERTVTARRWEVLRSGLGAIYILGGIAHLVLAVRAPEIYAHFAEQALVGAYTDLWAELVVPNLAVLVPLVGLFELAVGAALLWRARSVRLGHIGGAAFQLGLVLSGPWGIINAGLALLHAAGARLTSPTSVPARIRAWRRG
jgi:hypothetical protein